MNKAVKRILFVMCAAAAVGGLRAEEGGSEPGKGWRISVGPTFGGPLRTTMRVAPLTMPSYVAPLGSQTKSEAERVNNAIGRSRVELGGGYYVDPEDSAGIAGESWNYHLPAGSVNERTHSFDIRNSYVDVIDSGRASSFCDKDERMDYGASVMLEREVFRKGSFGVDIGGMVSWMMRDNAFKASGTVGGQSVETGSYLASIGIEQDVDVNDPYFVNPDGSYGYGSFDGPGYPLILVDPNITRTWMLDGTREVSRMHLSMKGDYQEVELAFLIRPWYEVADWLRAVGTLGAGVSYARFSLATDVSVDGTRTARSHEAFDAWDVYGLAGLGLMARYEDFCLGFDFLTKIGDDSLKVNSRYARGALERESTSLRIYIGCEF